LQEKNKDLINKLDERIKSVENNLAINKNNKTYTSHKEYSTGIRTLFELVLGFLIGGFIGYYLDSILSTSPIFLLLGIFIGGISGIYTIWKKNIYEHTKK
jgi:F0F1-type ATP synthase assembly protein I